MNVLPTLTFPRAIFRNLKVRQTEAKLSNRVAMDLADGRPLAQQSIDRLKYYPHIFARKAALGDIPFAVRNEVMADPYVAFLVVMDNYRVLGPILEEHYIMRSPVAVELLIRNHRTYPKSLRLMESDYLAYLAEIDPARFLNFVPEDQLPHEIHRLLADPRVAHPTSAAWLYFGISTSSFLDLSADWLALLGQEEEYLYRTALLFRQRIAAGSAKDDGTIDSCLTRIRTPRWAYHVLRDGLVESGSDLEQSMIEIVESDPAWLAELCMLEVWNPLGEFGKGNAPLAAEAFEIQFASTAKTCHAHPLLDEWIDWGVARMNAGPAELVRRIGALSKVA